jgi:cell division septation protein DedD
MPDLNLKDEEEFSKSKSENPARPRQSRFHTSGGDNSNKILLIAIIVLIVLGVVMLNQFGVIHLWGTGDSQVVVDLPPLEEEPVEPLPEAREPDLTPTPETETEAVPPTVTREPERREQPREIRPTGSGMFTVQVSAWRDQQKAETQAQRIRNAGKDAFVDATTLNGVTWYRVRIGRYATREEAERDARDFQLLLETGWWVDRIDN